MVSLFEIAHKVTSITETELPHDFFNAQKSCFEKFLSSTHFLYFQILGRSHSHILLEKMAKA